MVRVRGEHGVELEVKRKAESRVRNLESEIASVKEDIVVVRRKLEKEEKENQKVFYDVIMTS